MNAMSLFYEVWVERTNDNPIVVGPGRVQADEVFSVQGNKDSLLSYSQSRWVILGTHTQFLKGTTGCVAPQASGA